MSCHLGFRRERFVAAVDIKGDQLVRRKYMGFRGNAGYLCNFTLNSMTSVPETFATLLSIV